MNKLTVDLKHCFGIQTLKNEFDFTKKNSIIIYAPNGVMKSSFAKTFDCIAKNDKKNKPRDMIYSDRKTICNILVDNKPINPGIIYVADAETDTNTDESISTFLASKELKNEYDKIYKDLDSEKSKFRATLISTSQSTDCEEEITSTFKKADNDDFYTCLLSIETEIKKDKIFYDFRYNDIFDKKGYVETFIETHRELIQQYFDDYNALLNKSNFFKSNNDGASFGTYQAEQLIKSVTDEAFFSAKHQLLLNDNTKISSSDQLKSIVLQEITKVLNDEKLKSSFDKIDNAIGKNIELRKFKDAIEKNRTIIPLLLNYNNFKKEVWYGYLHKLEKETQSLIDLFKNKKKQLNELLKKAKEESDTWQEIIRIYNERFDVPFIVSIKNQDDIILKEEAPNLLFQYKDMIGDPIEKERDSILQVLSRGEKRAFYILQFLFEIEARKKTNTESLIILDDIADSFDYKNKYAIVEYINDLNKTGLFKQIILTHNFDFYRTIVSRLNLESSAFMATCNNEEVKIKQGRYLKDVFKRYLTPNANQPKIFISLIPFVRNIVEYTKGDGPEYKNLTSCLHIKEETEKIRAIDICKILKKNIEHCKDLDINAFSNRKIYDLIIETADAIIKEDIIDDILLENKMVLSIAIRLKTEKYLIHKLEGRININEINHDQTRVLIDKYKDIITKEDKIDKILERVNLMTPENIHVNTFMYEPLIDMSVNHLVDLYKDISNLT